MDEKLKKREKFCKIYTISIFVLFILSILYSLVVKIIMGIDGFISNEIPFVFISIGIIFTIVVFVIVNWFIAANNYASLDNKTDIYVQKKEFSQGVSYLTNFRNKACSTLTFKGCTLFIGYLYMFIGDKEKAYNELSYFLKKKMLGITSFFVVYLFYVLCIILEKDEEIRKLQDNYRKLLKKYNKRINKDADLFRYKTLIDHLISNEFELGFEPLVKHDCKLVVDYCNKLK